jgi:hypothetical protein
MYLGVEALTLCLFLFMQDIIKRTPEDHPDYKNLKQAQDTMVYTCSQAKLHVHVHVYPLPTVHVHVFSSYVYMYIVMHAYP